MEAAVLRDSVPPGRARGFSALLGTLVVLAVVLAAAPLRDLPAQLPGLPLACWLMAALAVCCDARPFTPARRRRHEPVVETSVCFTFAILLAWGFAPAFVTAVLAALAGGLRARQPRWRIVLRAARHTCALAATAVATAAVTGAGAFVAGGISAPTDRPGWVAAAGTGAATWFAARHAITTAALRLRRGGRWWTALRRGLATEVFATGSLLALSPGLVVAARSSAALIPFVLVPLSAIAWLARLAAQRDEQARIDPLTGLANRRALLAEVVRELPAHAEQAAKGVHGRHLALLLVDLDRFKQVNDALGHAAGDRLLVEVAGRISRAVRPEDVVARLGGDEFAILATRLRDAADARAVAARVTAALAEPVPIDGLPLEVGGSIGIALYPEHGLDSATLIRHADVAMYDAKRRGDTLAVYAPESDHNSPERLGLLADLRRVLQRRDADADAGAGPGATAPAAAESGVGEIRMYYQPQVAIATGDVVGVEALLRWRHPVRGMVDPEELIRVAEQSAVMRRLTRRVVDDVIEQVAKWSAAGLRLRASVNVSVRDLQHDEIAEQIAERLTAYGVPATQLQLEITEGALMLDPRRVLATISRLDRIGVGISLDDFGTGYSSLQHLRRLPLAEVKIDRSFVLGIPEEADDAAIVRSVIGLGGALGLRVVAEGVEDEHTWRFLHAAGCDVAQGWFYARPMPAEDLAAWLARYRPLRPGAPREPSGRHCRDLTHPAGQ